MTYSDILSPQTRLYSLVYDITLILGGSLAVALLAQVAVPLPFTPVPITGQTLGVLLIGALLGRWRGTLAILAYLTEGISGLPVFAGGLAGPAVLAGPTGGYLIGFVFSAYLVGWLAEEGWDRKPVTTFIMMGTGTALILITGAIFLTLFVPGNQVISMGIIPFIPGALVKIGLAVVLLPTGWKLLGDRNER